MYLLMRLYLILIFTLLAIGCPSLCLCKWKSGKKWVQCRGHNFQDLPEGVQEETQVLDLSDNQFLNLPNNRFYELRLINLQRLYLKNSKIQRLSAKTFTGLQGLVELDLSENQLEKIPPKVFSPLHNLMRLNLAGNLLTILPRNVFSNLGQLIFLDISRCHISQIETRTFTGLRALEWLRLNDNMLENISESVLPLTASLHGLSLHGNPWKCNCHLLTLHRWLDTSQDQVPQEVDPRCNEPARLRNMPVRTLKNHELACIPFVQLTGGLDIVKEGNVTLQCKVVAVPPGQPQWFLNGKRLEFDYRSSSIKNVKFKYRYFLEADSKQIIGSLIIAHFNQTDQGNYICQAENIAGISQSNITLYYRQIEGSTVKPLSKISHAGNTAVIAAGALLGVLFSFSCLFSSIFLYARRKHSRSTDNFQQKVLSSDLVPSSLLEKNLKVFSVEKKSVDSEFIHVSANDKNLELDMTDLHSPVGSNNCHNDQNSFHHKTETFTLHDQDLWKHFIDKDLMSKVFSGSNVTFAPNYVSYEGILNHNHLDCDGYPLNFGLPKLNQISNYFCKNGQNVIQCNQHHGLDNSVETVVNESSYVNTTYSPEKKKSRFPLPTSQQLPTSHIKTTVTHNFCLGNTYLDGVGKLEVLAPYTNHCKFYHHLNKQTNKQEDLEYSESPDEGYVGDAMDV